MDPRVARSRAKIAEAVLASLAEDGYERLTIEGVAARAGVGKTTIYRHWDSKAELVADAVGSHHFQVEVSDSGDLRTDLMAILGGLAERLGSAGTTRLIPAMISAAEVDPELEGLHRRLVQERRGPLLGVLRAAIGRGDLPENVDVEVAADMLSGPLFFRRFISREPVTIEFVEQLVDTLLPRLGTICLLGRHAQGGRHSGKGRPRGKMHGTAHRRAGRRGH